MIKISDKVRISRLDKTNLQVEEYRKIIDQKTKAERYDWCWVGYYGDLKSAIGGVLKYCGFSLVEEELNGWREVLKRLCDIEIDLKDKFKGF